nr:Maf family nucleotide pyrophosphatase [Bacteroidota bacterium]
MSTNFSDHKLILASKSPRRQYLLKELGFDFEVRTKEVNEDFPDALKAEEIPLYLCKKKADAFEEELNDSTIVITADTIVWINGQVLNKPEDHEDAVRMLRLLSGNRHEVYTGVCLRSKNRTRSFFVKSDVYFKHLSIQQIEFYINHYQPFDKAGSYGAQECLPPGMNPCSKEEIDFLGKLGKLNLISESRSEMKEGSVSVEVEKINGSYFN